MTTLLTPPAGDPRTPEEYTYDMIKAGEYYKVAPEPSNLLTDLKDWVDENTVVATPDRRREIARQIDRAFADQPTLEIERHKFNEEGEPYNEPWVSFTYGQASLDIGDRGNGNVCLYGQMFNFRSHEFGPLSDLAALLSHPTVKAALALQEDPRVEIAHEADSLLAELDNTDVEVEEWQDDEEGGPMYTDFKLGDGLTRVMIGTHGGDKAGIELVIGGETINDKVDEVITLDDVRQIRDNLTMLLNDPRVQAWAA